MQKPKRIPEFARPAHSPKCSLAYTKTAYSKLEQQNHKQSPNNMIGQYLPNRTPQSRTSTHDASSLPKPIEQTAHPATHIARTSQSRSRPRTCNGSPSVPLLSFKDQCQLSTLTRPVSLQFCPLPLLFRAALRSSFDCSVPSSGKVARTSHACYMQRPEPDFVVHLIGIHMPHSTRSSRFVRKIASP